MGFNNGYDAGWQDAINAVKYGKVPGLGPVANAPQESQAPDQAMTLTDMLDVLYDARSDFVAGFTAAEVAGAAYEKANEIAGMLSARTIDLAAAEGE